MPSQMVTATIQSTLITLCSCIIAQFLTPDNPPHYISLITYGVLATPPNFLWQQAIEKYFPGYKLKKVEVDDGGKGAEVEKKLNVRNTIIKVVLDQTVAAVPNVVGYLGVTRWLRGVPLDMCWNAVKEVCDANTGLLEHNQLTLLQQTWPIMWAGYKLWPAVNVVQHVFVPVEKKILVGNLVGMGWGTFLTLRASR